MTYTSAAAWHPSKPIAVVAVALRYSVSQMAHNNDSGSKKGNRPARIAEPSQCRGPRARVVFRAFLCRKFCSLPEGWPASSQCYTVRVALPSEHAQAGEGATSFDA